MLFYRYARHYRSIFRVDDIQREFTLFNDSLAPSNVEDGVHVLPHFETIDLVVHVHPIYLVLYQLRGNVSVVGELNALKAHCLFLAVKVNDHGGAGSIDYYHIRVGIKGLYFDLSSSELLPRYLITRF